MCLGVFRFSILSLIFSGERKNNEKAVHNTIKAKNMEVQNLRKEISQLIDNIKEHSDRITDFERIPQLELETILFKIGKLYEKSVVFNYLYKLDKQDFKEKEISMNNSEKTAETVALVEAPHIIEVERNAEEENCVKEDLNSTQIRPSQLTAENNIEEIDSLDRANVAETKTHVKSAENTLNDINTRLKENNKAHDSLNEKIAGQNKLYASLSSKLQGNAIKDLPKAIGVNERFLFIKELFGNDSHAFQQAVSKLNSLQSLVLAENFLKEELAIKFNWKADSPAVKSFVELVQRRFN
ncbi:MAG: hypothetical protein H0V01_02855 [Bacteroidetes bacterium]|nr:hypothetical protein [Bacteroidota bacterium]HET6244751.1 hypothetical protein [Bacteroidia bacterium]